MADTQNRPAVGVRLSVMMFLQFFVWGAWYVTAAKYLSTIGFSGSDIGTTYSVGPVAAILSPFFVGMIADRFFATERVLGVMHLLGAALMFAATVLMRQKADPGVINFALFGHMLCYMPTLALTNTLALSNLTRSEQLPWVRVFGTIGWIAAGFTIGGFALEGTWRWGDRIDQFTLAAVASALLGVYSFTLPHTPPPSAGKRVTAWQVFGLDALVLLRNRSYLVFLISSFLICIPLSFYYQLAERAVTAADLANPPITMSFGQISEIVFMLLLPVVFVRLGVKWTLLVGMAAWVIRYVLFALGTPDDIAWMMLVGVVLHGICYDFFFVTGQIYTDKVASPAIRGQAQGLLVLATLGLGMAIGAQIAGYVETQYTPAETGTLLGEANEVGERLTALDPNSAAAKELEAEKDELTRQAYSAMDWQTIWTIPAGASLVVLLIFAAVFRDRREHAVTDKAEAFEAAERQELF
ncbi:MAG: nucleoside permease [Planctomycetaceae bacterium]|nr:nucleoside permease [Planctomycetaceae bacterium]